jgi:hypothetical protein
MNIVTAPGADIAMAGFGNAGGTRQSGLGYKSSDGKWYACAQTDGGAVAFGATGVTLGAGWHFVDMKINASANPWTVDVSVDGTTLGQVTVGLASNNQDKLILGAFDPTTIPTWTGDIFFDDVLASNTLADYPFGDGYVNQFVSVSDGTHNVAGAADFKHGTAGTDITNATTDAWTLVADVPLPTGTPSTTDLISNIAPPNATDYVKVIIGPAPGISTPTTGPRAVEAIAAIHQAGTGTGNMEIRLDDNGTKDAIYSATTVAGTTAFKYVRKHYATAPSTGAAWTSALFNAIQVEFGSPAAVDANPDQYYDAMMFEGEFVQVAAPGRAPTRNRMRNWPSVVASWLRAWSGWLDPVWTVRKGSVRHESHL